MKGLDKSDLIEGEDYIQGLAGEDYALYWLRDDLDLKEFKLAIGAKYVWKHRMRFFSTIEEMKPVVIDEGLTDSDLAFMKRVREEILMK
jgi:hypothetical protein